MNPGISDFAQKALLNYEEQKPNQQLKPGIISIIILMEIDYLFDIIYELAIYSRFLPVKSFIIVII